MVFSDRTERALARWPNVPALYGWLRLNERGQWLIRDGVITNTRVIDAICRNYSCDEHGCWFFQNGPQRGYVALDHTPLVLFAQPGGELTTHTGHLVTQVKTALLDESGALVLDTEHGPAVLHHEDLDWALARLTCETGILEDALEKALAQDSGTPTGLWLATPPSRSLRLSRCDRAAVSGRLGFVREPRPV